MCEARPEPKPRHRADGRVPAHCRVTAWRPEVAGIAEVFHASMVDYAYPSHQHDTWTVLIVDDGAIRYDLDTRECGALGQIVAVLPPGVTHNGQPASGAPGFRKRVLYLDADGFPDDAFSDELVGAAVDHTNIDDPVLRATLADLHDRLSIGDDDLGVESGLALAIERLVGHLAGRVGREPAAEPTVAAALRAMLDEAVGRPFSLDEASRALGRSKAHLIRSFGATYRVAPNAYLIGRRIEAARGLLLDGMAPADVAAVTGFYDQAHLTRHFKRHTATTPAAYATSRP